MRYAANRSVAALRERFPGRTITSRSAELFVVELAADTAALHLTHQGNLDALGVDDRINTGRLDTPGGDALLDLGQELSDALYDWWAGDPPAIVYRTRSVPSARSVAFREGALTPVRARPLREATRLLATLVARHGFTVPGAWLS